jgi:hypothetical protein
MIIGINMQQSSGAVHPPDGLNGDLNEATEEEAELEGNYGHENQLVSPQIHQPMNGDLPPPRQVYVSEVVGGMAHPGMASLDNQFQSLGLQQEQVMGAEHPGNTNENGDDLGSEGIEGEENEEDPVKLFVGQVSIWTDIDLALMGELGEPMKLGRFGILNVKMQSNAARFKRTVRLGKPKNLLACAFQRLLVGHML